MRVKLLGFKGYDYLKNGERKVGISLYVQTSELFAEDDQKGNFEYGYRVDSIFLPRALYGKASPADLQQYLGREIDLIYEKRLGDRYERLTDIILVEEPEANT